MSKEVVVTLIGMGTLALFAFGFFHWAMENKVKTLVIGVMIAAIIFGEF